MKVEFTITFTKEDLVALCRKKVQEIETPCAGYFEVEASRYTPEVIATFREGLDPVTQALVPIPLATEQPEQAEEDDDAPF